MNNKVLALAISGLFASTAAMAESMSWEDFKISIGPGGHVSQSEVKPSASRHFNTASQYATSSNRANNAS